MGSATCRAIQADQGLALVAEVGRDEPLRALVDAGAEVAVDFTTPDAVKDHIRFCLDAQVHAVVGTTGLTEADLVEALEKTLDCPIISQSAVPSANRAN